jgi:hypothetical protein
LSTSLGAKLLDELKVSDIIHDLLTEPGHVVRNCNKIIVNERLKTYVLSWSSHGPIYYPCSSLLNPSDPALC